VVPPKKQTRYQEKVDPKKEEKSSKVVKVEEDEAPKVQPKEFKS
jgi:hypothetical protein